MEFTGDAMRQRQQKRNDIDVLRERIAEAWERYDGKSESFNIGIPDGTPVGGEAVQTVIAELGAKGIHAETMRGTGFDQSCTYLVMKPK